MPMATAWVSLVLEPHLGLVLGFLAGLWQNPHQCPEQVEESFLGLNQKAGKR